jgi:hypothetical protein
MGPGDMRGVDKLIIPAAVLFPPEGLDLISDQGALGMPQDQAGTNLFLDAEQFEFPA